MSVFSLFPALYFFFLLFVSDSFICLNFLVNPVCSYFQCKYSSLYSLMFTPLLFFSAFLLCTYMVPRFSKSRILCWYDTGTLFSALGQLSVPNGLDLCFYHGSVSVCSFPDISSLRQRCMSMKGKRNRKVPIWKENYLFFEKTTTFFLTRKFLPHLIFRI